MKGYQALLPLAALASAFVIPDDAVMNEVKIERNTRDIFNKLNSPQEILDDARDKFANVVEVSHDAFDSTVHSITDTFESVSTKFDDVKEEVFGHHHGHHDHDHDHPHHPHDPSKANLTVYQLITQNKYTTKFAKLVDEFDDVVKYLNKTSANVTVFVPTDKAFEKIPDRHKKPSKEILEAVLSYHIVPDYYPAGRVFGSHTIPTAFNSSELSEEANEPQRLNVKLGFTGLFLDSFSRIIYPNVFGTNGVVHAIDSILIPPPRIAQIIKFSPQAFSTLELAFLKTGLEPEAHTGATFFGPPNFAWAKLGPRANAFLFSKYGEKYLKALLQYHIVLNQTLYSDAFYGPKDDSKSSDNGLFHVDLPTLLEDKSLSVDIGRYGRLIELKVNAFSRAVYQDGVARDGVLHVVDNVLIPPKKVGNEEVHYKGGELSVEEIVEHLQPFVGDDASFLDGNLEL